MIFISAGHNSKSKTVKADPGAINKHGVKEGDLTIEFVDLVCNHLTLLGAKFVRDSDEEGLEYKQVMARLCANTISTLDQKPLQEQQLL